jgi:hypothetical protein
VRAGVLLGVLASIKYFYGLFLVYFVLIRAWRGLLAMLAAGCGMVVVSVAVFGVVAYQQYSHVLQLISWYSSSWNASSLGFWRRLLGGEGNWSLWQWPQAVPSLVIVTNLGLLLSYVGYARNWPRHNQVRNQALFAYTLVLMLLLSPLGWLYYFLVLLIPLLMLYVRFMAQDVSVEWSLMLAAGVLLLNLPLPLYRPHQLMSGMGCIAGVVPVLALVLILAMLWQFKRLPVASNYLQTCPKLPPVGQAMLVIGLLVPSILTNLHYLMSVEQLMQQAT